VIETSAIKRQPLWLQPIPIIAFALAVLNEHLTLEMLGGLALVVASVIAAWRLEAASALNSRART
jgi:drug/metabolite transporter (DMT)-like permease